MNDSQISALALIGGFLLIISDWGLWSIVVGAALILIAFLVPFWRLK